VQNQENKGLLLRLCAGSLSLQVVRKIQRTWELRVASSRFGTAGNWMTSRRRHYSFAPLGLHGSCLPTPACAVGAAFLRRFAAGGGSQIGVWRKPSAAEAGGSSRSCGMAESMPFPGSIDALRRSELPSQIIQKSVLSKR
jgi:hypothetical protein